MNDLDNLSDKELLDMGLLRKSKVDAVLGEAQSMSTLASELVQRNAKEKQNRIQNEKNMSHAKASLQRRIEEHFSSNAPDEDYNDQDERLSARTIIPRENVIPERTPFTREQMAEKIFERLNGGKNE